VAGQTIAISILADTKKLASGLNDARGMLGKLGSSVGGAAKLAVGAVAGIGAAIGGLAAAGGIARALNIDTAQTKLKALGYDAAQMQDIMNSALASVKGTSYGLGDAATLASQALAAGIPQGESLTKALSLVTNTAALAGSSLGDMGSIFSKVWTAGRVGTEELNQLADRGIPIWTTLANSLGVGVGELRSMVSAGQVTADMFTSALEPAVTGIAGTMGTSFTGLASNIMAALGRIGAIFAGPAIEAAKPWMAFLITGLDSIAGLLTPLGEKFGSFLSGITPPDLSEGFSISGIVDMLLGARQAVVEGALQMFSGLAEALPAIVPQIIAGTADLIGTIINYLATSGPTLLTSAVGMLSGLVTAVAQVVPPLLTALIALLPQLVSAILGMLPAILAAGVELLTALVNAVPLIIPPLIATVIEILPKLVETIVGMIPALIDGSVSLFTALVDAIPIIIPALITAVLDLLPKLIASLLAMIPKLIEGAVKLFTGIVEAIPRIIPTLIPALLNLLPTIVSTLIGMIPTLIQAGIDLIGGLVEGLWKAAGAVGKALLDIIGGAIDGFLSFLGIHSPSRLFRSYGGNVVAGLVAGLSAGEAALARQMGELSSAVADNFSPEVGFDMSPSGALTASSVTSSGRAAAPQVQAPVSLGGMVELSPYDRQLLITIADRVGITITQQSLQAVVNGGNTNAATRRAA